MVCLEILVEKIRQSAALFRFGLRIVGTSRNPKNNYRLSRIFGAGFGGKDRGLPIQPVIPTSRRGLDAFLYEAA
jgi:hypothetical protein